MKNFTVFLTVFCLTLCGCHESMNKRAEREAMEYTKKYCPTPVQNHTRTDSVVFDNESKTFIYYCSIFDELDNQEIFNKNRIQISNALLDNLKESTQLRAYKKEGFGFRWVITSAKNSKVVYFDQQFTPKEYDTPTPATSSRGGFIPTKTSLRLPSIFHQENAIEGLFFMLIHPKTTIIL